MRFGAAVFHIPETLAAIC